MGRRKKTRSVVVTGRKWFQKSYGNTYHRTRIYVNGEHVHDSGRTYGYGDQWEWTGREWLKANGYLPGIEEYPHGGSECLPRYCERNGIELVREAANVERMKDL